MADNDDFPQHTLIDTDLVPEADDGDKTSVALPPTADRGATRPAAPPVEDEDEAPGKTTMMQSPFAETGPAPAPAAVPAVEARLTVAFGNDRGREFPLPTSTVVIGRALECQIVLNDAAVSRRHFQIDYADERWFLKDLGSGNGTKVGGSRVAEIALEDGVQIEAGQTLLTYNVTGAPEAEERTRALDVASLPEEPEEDDANKTVVRPAMIDEMRVQPAPRIAIQDAAKPPVPVRRTGTLPLVVVGILGLLVIGVAVAQFGLGLRILPLGGEETVATTGPDPRAEAEEIQGRALKAMAAKQWDQAATLLAEAAARDPSLEGVETARARALEEKRNAALLAAAKVSLEKGQPAEALAVLGRVQDTSVYYGEARKQMAALSDATIGKEIDRLRGLLAERKKGEAKVAYVALVEAHPEDPRVAALRDELAAAGIALDPPRPAVAAAVAPAPSTGTPAPGPGKGGKGRPDVDRALSLYNAGDFPGAAADLRAAAERSKGDDAQRARDLAAKIDRFAAAFGQGKSGLAQKRLDQAEAGLSQALRVDHDINGHFDAEIRGLLGDTYRGRAALAVQNADYVLASRSARKALSYRGDDALARNILDKCLAVAQTWYDQAAADAQAGRKDAARQKAKPILDVVPPGHPLAEKAAEMMR